jgi:translation initiation factor 5B
MIRQPIVTVLGHVDHGKTSLLDCIRETNVVKKEAGAITQHVSATEISLETLERFAGKSFKGKIKIPGLLFIDTPGHEAFTMLRKRGGALADIAILVIDIREGIMPQTLESITILKHRKTPFIVAATKIDLVQDLEEKIYNLIGQLAKEGFDADRFDKIDDFTKKIAIVPVSSKTKEGIGTLMLVLLGIAQKYLKDHLALAQGMGKGTVLEVSEMEGFGHTIDVILYDGMISKGDTLLVLGSEGVIYTKIKGIFYPQPGSDTRVGKKFKSCDHAGAACGVRIYAKHLDKVLAGSPVRCGPNLPQRLEEEILQEFKSSKIQSDEIGVVVKADTYGAL